MKNTETQPTWSVVVPSCDFYRDLWPFFFHFLFKCWPEVPTPIYLISNFCTYEDLRVKTILTGRDKSWSTNINQGLQQVPSKYLIFLLDDFLLDQVVDHSYVETLVQELNRLDGNFLELDCMYDHGIKVGNIPLRQMTLEKQRVGMTVSMWKRDFFIRVCKPGLNIWQAENNLKYIAKTECEGIYTMDKDGRAPFRYVESVKGRFWKTIGIDYLKEHNLTPDLKFRPYPPQGRDIFSKLIRSFFKRWMYLRTLWEQITPCAAKDRQVKPLKGPKAFSTEGS